MPTPHERTSHEALHIGSTGYIGSAVTRALGQAGHDVVELLRPSQGHSLSDHRIRIGDLTDLRSLRDAVTDDIDGVVHTGAPLGDWTADALAVRTLLDDLRADGMFVYLSGTWVLGAAHADGPSPKAHRLDRSASWTDASR
jgi:nucleoside-diphosphate-sugar epimerase